MRDNYSIWRDGKSHNWPETFYVDKEIIKQSKASRRMKKALYRAARTLALIQKVQRRRKAKLENFEIRRQVETLKAEKRRPGPRVRSRFEACAVYLPKDSARNGGVVSVGPHRAAWKGSDQSIQDYRPVLRLNPPRNPVTIKTVRFSALSSDIRVNVTPAVWALRPKSHWASYGMGVYGLPVTSKMSDDLGYSKSRAAAAVQKAVAKVNEPEILDGNEYIVEFRQVLNLLKDPVRTLVGFHKVLERWTRRDAWIFLPNRTARRLSNGGTLVSKLPLGGVLMSMRTKRTISTSEVSSATLHAAANRWLQYRYGIAPLAKDITKVMSILVGGACGEPLKSKTARLHVFRNRKVAKTTNFETPFTLTFQHKWVRGEHYTAKQWYRLKHEIPNLAKIGLHPEQWLRAFWNAVPYSFVADWVVNIDQWLLSTMDPPWIELGPNVVTQKVFEKTTSICVSASYIGYPGVFSGLPLASKTFEGITRHIDVPKATGPLLSDAWQTVKNAGTALALLLNLTKRR